MHRRRRHRSQVLAALCLVATLGVAGCQRTAEPGGSATPEEPSAEEPAAEGPTPENPTPENPTTEGGDAGEATTSGGAVDASVPPLHPAIDDLPESVVTITTSDGEQVRVDVKVAQTSDERRRGLMEVAELPEGVGMLFLFEEERTGGFWMWNTLVPLDIAFIGSDGAIVEILAMDPCEADDAADCPTYGPEEPYVAALEVPQGWFAWQGVAAGGEVRWTDPSS